MIIATSTAQTASASRYLQQLCKHFAHKVPADWNDTRGEVNFPFGFCTIEAGEGSLVIRCEAEAREDMDRTRAVIDDHLERFAWREKLKLEWRDA